MLFMVANFPHFSVWSHLNRVSGDVMLFIATGLRRFCLNQSESSIQRRHVIYTQSESSIQRHVIYTNSAKLDNRSIGNF